MNCRTKILRISLLLFILWVLSPTLHSGIGIAMADSVIATIHVGMNPQAAAVNTNTGSVYVVDYSSNTVSVISPNNQVIATIPVGKGPIAVAFNPNTGNVYVNNVLSNTVSVISPNNQVIATIPVGS